MDRESVTISKKHVLLVLMVALIYIILSDQMKRPDLQSQVKKILGKTLDENSTHTMVDWMSNRTNQLASLLAVSTVTIANALPSYVRDPKPFIYSAVVGSALYTLKYNGMFNFGFISKEKQKEVQINNNNDNTNNNNET